MDKLVQSTSFLMYVLAGVLNLSDIFIAGFNMVLELHNLSEKTEWIPARVVFGILIFTISAASNMLNSSMGVIIVSMVVPPNTSIIGDPQCLSDNQTSIYYVPQPDDIDKRFNWSEVIQSIILSITSLGYSIIQFPGGLVAQKFGSRGVIFWTTLIATICTALIPVCAQSHYVLVIVIRLFIGLCGGAMHPAIHTAIAHWVPPKEKSKFVWCGMGGTMGAAVTFILCGALVDSVGWQNMFYIIAGIMLIVCLIWFFLMHNTPQEHPRITQKELQYIENGIGSNISKGQKLKFPAKKVFTSVPVLVLLFLYIGTVWGMVFPMLYGPKFMKEALGFSIQSTGGLAALPYITRITFAIMFSTLADFIRAKDLISVTLLRKIMTIFSHIVPAALLITVGEVGCQTYIAVVCFILSLGFNGAAVGGCLANQHDLAPNFAGILFGIGNGMGSLFSALSGFIAGVIINEKSGLREWQIIWNISAGVYIFTALLYFIWGTGEMQPWNSDDSVNITEAANQQTPQLEMGQEHIERK